MPTSAAARAPNACEIAIRWGIAVIGMKIASAAPIDDPTIAASAIQRKSMISPCSRVPMIAAVIPISPARTPRRAVVGCDNHLSERMKPALAPR